MRRYVSGLQCKWRDVAVPALAQTLAMQCMARQASFGLADELRRRCSGAASAALMLSHWERLQARSAPCQTTSTYCSS